ncbi:solute carrier family 52, riboflavin transporter, member 3-B-like [Biomphalaria glabrata]|uniref:Riboflavin transporter n=1 Tax=Biomphalaria glabrata TaxID=6526 RepID=A0A9W2YD18_BIOGL|nr:solute carrier family 52, riboflavin transporter, member 3-B-like [Biomphalaria glabrata]XP_055860647.1 solute carrier family 52, riboflavin transporter, member 3-B-like [Biomphalaria glabrata]XP_055860648.1 solute carrier family 52, riboflavin transporter, member 3-B-like [Biomphalaria glabrata]XP_055860649.1 solute carrier family 52, riboflavin transporter, member 3-B-like [Biomphalaria glabrata]XP_055860650.1 solute carrier family 52, riboflavin transporter, member 3-B-like [Biomphalaria 
MRFNLRSSQDNSKFGVHVLVVLLGITSWSIMNGLWVELPILVVHLPEGWTLPSYLTIICQFGNIGPLVFSLLVYLTPRKKIETPTAFVIVVALTLCAALYGFLWQQRSPIGSKEHSVALMSLTLCQSIFAATTSMAYLAFMSHLKAQYIGSIFIGMSLSGLIPALAAIGQVPGEVECVTNASNITNVSLVYETRNFSQSILLDLNLLGPGMEMTSNHNVDSARHLQNVNGSEVSLRHYNEEPSFSVKYFFLMLASLGGFSFLSLVLLIHHPYCKTEHVDTKKEDNCRLVQINSFTNDSKDTQAEETVERTQFDQKQLSTVHTELQRHQQSDCKEDDASSDKSIEDESIDFEKNAAFNSLELEDKDEKEGQLSRAESWYLLGLLAWINMLQTSFVLAIQVFSSLPYGLFFYNGATKAENIVDPIACFLTMWVRVKSLRVISLLTLLGTLFSAYIIIVAAMSPNPFLVKQTAGGILIIAAWVISTALNVFAKVTIASVMRSQGRISLIYTGGSTQTGTLIGAVLAYVMINELRLFKDSPWC